MDTILDYKLDGIDLDIEESVKLQDIKKLIVDIKNHTNKNFIISTAPLLSSLQQDIPGMGGFVYKDLFISEEGKYIDYFNVHWY